MKQTRREEPFVVSQRGRSVSEGPFVVSLSNHNGPFRKLPTAQHLRKRLAALPALALVLWQLPAVDWRQPFLPAGADLRREALYARVGADLRRALPPGAVIAAPEIGALGYASGLPILDTVGLVSPRALRYYPVPMDSSLDGDNVVPARLITDLQPDAVVALDQFVRHSLEPDPAFQQAYRLDAAYPASIWQSERLLVFRRVAPPAQP